MGDIPTQQEAREGLEAAMIAAIGMTRSKQRAEDLVQDAFEAVMTTRPWSRAKRTFTEQLVGAVWSMASHEHTSKRPKKDAEAHEGFHDEEIGRHAPSPEYKTLDRAEQETRQSDAEGELDELDAAVSDNTTARDVLRCRCEHGLVKAGEIATKLGIDVDLVYTANKLLQDRLRALRKKKAKKKDES